MYMKMFYFELKELLKVESEVNAWVESVQTKYKIMNISPPSLIHGLVTITVVYVER